MNAERRSIRTEYRGVVFRSKLEADWARHFDALGLKWEYEPRGRYFGDQFYLVDFYLPCSRQWIEVKGVYEPADVRKIIAFLEHIEPRRFTNENCPDIALVACEPDGVFRGWERGACKRSDNLLEMSRKASHELVLFQCAVCRGWWFADESLSWRCQCCGAYDGDGHLADRLTSPLADLPSSNSLLLDCPDSSHAGAD